MEVKAREGDNKGTKGGKTLLGRVEGKGEEQARQKQGRETIKG